MIRMPDGKKYLLAPLMEAARARRMAANRVEVVSPAALGLKARKKNVFSEWILALLRRLSVNSVNVPNDFPLGLAERLRRRGIRVRAVPDKPFPERAIKSETEIAMIAMSQRAAVRAMRLAAKMLARSDVDRRGALRLDGRELTSELMRGAIDNELFKLGKSPGGTIVSCGAHSADPHERGSGPLRACEPIVIDIFPFDRDNGYWGDLTRTFVKGRAPPALAKMHGAVCAARAVAFARIRAGAGAAAAHNAVKREFERLGFETGVKDGGAFGFIHGLGHGVGLEVHEAPSLSPSGAGSRLKAGNVVTVEPGLYYPEIGGVRVEDTVVVRAKGCEFLAECETELESR